jgi:hypothetical protein
MVATELETELTPRLSDETGLTADVIGKEIFTAGSPSSVFAFLLGKAYTIYLIRVSWPFQTVGLCAWSEVRA